MASPLIIHGQLVGHAVVQMVDGKVKATFRRNWPGWWHALALSLDRGLPPAGPT